LPPFLPPISLVPPASDATSLVFSFFSFFCTLSAGTDEDNTGSFEVEATGAVPPAAATLDTFSFFFGASAFL
jgi:hypothetical protein